MARYVIDVPGLAQLRVDYAALLLRVIALEAALEAGGGGTPSPFTYSLDFTDTRNSMYAGAIS
ncbi:MAG TPA: hypothetical protein VF637_17445 [Sphingomicrobium sp.]|jgi:hypothetical protein